MAPPRIDFHALSHRGVVRAENQDHVFAGRLSRTEERYLFAVADGVGGREGGAWASERTLQLLLEELSAAGVGFQSAVMAANRAVYEEAARNNERRGAATTLVAALVEGTVFSWANVGDSRLYIHRDGILHQLSRDHSLVEEELAAGRITAEQAAHSNYRNVITRSVGNQPAVDVDSEGPFQLEAGDILLLCSDGLHQLVTVAEMAEHATSMNPAAATDALIRLANQRGGPDNVSVVICAFESSMAPASETQVASPAVPEEHETVRTRSMPAPTAEEAPEPPAHDTKRIAVPPPVPEPPAAAQPPSPPRQPEALAAAVSPPAPVSKPAPVRQPTASQPRNDNEPRKGSGMGIRLIGFGIAAGATIGVLIGVYLRP